MRESRRDTTNAFEKRCAGRYYIVADIYRKRSLVASSSCCHIYLFFFSSFICIYISFKFLFCNVCDREAFTLCRIVFYFKMQLSRKSQRLEFGTLSSASTLTHTYIHNVRKYSQSCLFWNETFLWQYNRKNKKAKSNKKKKKKKIAI